MTTEKELKWKLQKKQKKQIIWNHSELILGAGTLSIIVMDYWRQDSEGGLVPLDLSVLFSTVDCDISLRVRTASSLLTLEHCGYSRSIQEWGMKQLRKLSVKCKESGSFVKLQCRRFIQACTRETDQWKFNTKLVPDQLDWECLWECNNAKLMVHLTLPPVPPCPPALPVLLLHREQ